MKAKPLISPNRRAIAPGDYVAIGARTRISEFRGRNREVIHQNYGELCQISPKLIWRVGLLQEDGLPIVTLWCCEIVKFCDYNESIVDDCDEACGVWKDTDLRKWLNSGDGFLSAFTASECDRILGYREAWGYENSPRLDDKVFILSGGGSRGLSSEGAADREQQIDTFIQSAEKTRTASDNTRICLGAFYWTRTVKAPLIWAVGAQGLYYDNRLRDRADHFGVRPAIKINAANFDYSGKGTLKSPYLLRAKK